MNAVLKDCDLGRDAFRWDLRGALAELAELRLRLRVYLAQRSVPAADVDATILAVHEASKNALRARAGQAVTIAVWIEDEVMYARVRDQGSGLAAGTSHRCPSPRHTHGRGLFLMHSLMDNVEIDCSDGTTVSMRRRLALKMKSA
jgi:anti-sigma regulatory factor (Ser/Thr protein kinase)